MPRCFVAVFLVDILFVISAAYIVSCQLCLYWRLSNVLLSLPAGCGQLSSDSPSRRRTLRGPKLLHFGFQTLGLLRLVLSSPSLSVPFRPVTAGCVQGRS